MTNEEALNDMLKKTFPRTIFIRGINETNKTQSIVFSDEWLKMPYKAESEEDGVFMIQKLIQCKDCKWFGEIGCAINIVDDSDKPKEDDFCSFAERK